jgi:hypothetical protein
MSKSIIFLVLLIAIFLLFIPSKAIKNEMSKEEIEELEIQKNITLIREYLISKKSPMADYAEVIVRQKHWKLLLGISAIESQFCKYQLGNNCWGITDLKGGYKQYDSIKEGIIDANNLIERWQKRGSWLTVEKMNCSYVVPCNPNWVLVVNQTIKKLDAITSR